MFVRTAFNNVIFQNQKGDVIVKDGEVELGVKNLALGSDDGVAGAARVHCLVCSKNHVRSTVSMWIHIQYEKLIVYNKNKFDSRVNAVSGSDDRILGNQRTTAETILLTGVGAVRGDDSNLVRVLINGGLVATQNSQLLFWETW